MYEREAERIAGALGGTLAGLHHVGSTAIPATRAKPIIDMLLEVGSLDDLDRKVPLLESMGYESKGEYGIPQRRYFRLDNAEGVRTHQLHAFEQGVPDVIRHLALRDYMRDIRWWPKSTARPSSAWPEPIQPTRVPTSRARTHSSASTKGRHCPGLKGEEQT